MELVKRMNDKQNQSELKFYEETKKRRNEETKKRRNENETKKRRNEETKKRRNENVTKKRRNVKLLCACRIKNSLSRRRNEEMI